jgi:hypothetical protein
MIVAGNLAYAEGLNDAQDGFADSSADRLTVDVDSHIRLRQGLDIEGSFLAVH